MRGTGESCDASRDSVGEVYRAVEAREWARAQVQSVVSLKNYSTYAGRSGSRCQIAIGGAVVDSFPTRAARSVPAGMILVEYICISSMAAALTC